MATAAIAAGGSILSGILGGKGASSAAKAQASAINNALNVQQSEFNAVNSDVSPFISGGTGAFEQLLRLTGLGDSNTGVSVNGNPAFSASEQQAGALSNLTDSPLFTGAYNTGADTILQNAAATGGLRGGNVQNSLAQFGSGLYSSVYQNDISNLLALSGIGTNAASTLAGAGQNNANAQSSLLTQLGNANATAAAAPYAAATSTLGGLANQTGSGGLASLLKSVTGGGSFTSPTSADMLSGLGFF